MATDSHDDIEIIKGPLLSTPLHLTGFLSGNTIQVEGDAGSLEFSVQLNIHKKQNSDHCIHFPDLNFPEFHASSNSDAVTPIALDHEDEGINIHKDVIRNNANDGNVPEKEDSTFARNNNSTIATRLRSGALSPVSSYRPDHLLSYGATKVHKSCWIRRTRKQKIERKRDVLEAVFRRRSFPIRPLNSYTFFIITNWATVNRSSFQSTSKKLSRMWCKMPQDEKKVFEDMASKDTERYKKQLMLLKNHVEGASK